MSIGSRENSCAPAFGPPGRFNAIARLRALAYVIAALTALACHDRASAAPLDASTSRAAREEAIRAIPYDKLDAAERSAISSVVSQASIFRRLPAQTIDCDPDMHQFLVRHPDVIVNIWSVMGVSKVSLERTGPDTFRASDGAGTVGRIKYCYANHDTHVIYADGTYDGPLFNKQVRARCVLVLKSGGLQETNGRYYITNRLDTFIAIEHVGVELIAKTFQPLVNRSADYNFAETAAFLASVSRTAEVNTAGMLKLSGKLTAVEPAVREQFAQLTVTVAQRASDRRSGQQTLGLKPLSAAEISATAAGK